MLRIEKITFNQTYSFGSQQPYIELIASLQRTFPLNIISDDFSISNGNFCFSRKNRKNMVDNYNYCFISNIVQIAKEILVSYNHLIFDDFKIVEKKDNVFVIIFPAFTPDAFVPALKLALYLMRVAQSRNEFVISERELTGKFEIIKAKGLRGFNTAHLIQVSLSMRIPCIHLVGNVFQLGYGSQSRHFDSSHTDETSVIAFGLVKDKLKLGEFLRSFGLPVARSQIVKDEVGAINFMNSINSPVVVKPANLDGGKGVYGWLNTPDEVCQAVIGAKKFSKYVMVEEFFFGTDHRIQIVNQRLHGIIERSPASVTGDGHESIADLIKMINLNRKEAVDDQRFLHQIIINEELERILKKQDYTLQSIPRKGQTVVLSAAANVGIGGHPKQLDPLVAHPDNCKLCIDICRLLRLDVAGVDLILPDIRVSWKKGGAHICEVNSQPQMFTTMFRPLLLEKFGPAGGKIPIVVLYENAENSDLDKWQNFFADLNFEGYAVVSDRFVMKGNSLSETLHTPCENSRNLLKDPETTALCYIVNNSSDVSRGWPFVYCDYFVHEGILDSKIKTIEESLRPSQFVTNFSTFRQNINHYLARADINY